MTRALHSVPVSSRLCTGMSTHGADHWVDRESKSLSSTAVVPGYVLGVGMTGCVGFQMEIFVAIRWAPSQELETCPNISNPRCRD